MPFSSAPAAHQQRAQDSKLEGSGKKPKKEKHKKESKEKKHKKHKREKKSKQGVPPLSACQCASAAPHSLHAKWHATTAAFAETARGAPYLMNLHSLNILYGQVLHD